MIIYLFYNIKKICYLCTKLSFQSPITRNFL